MKLYLSVIFLIFSFKSFGDVLENERIASIKKASFGIDGSQTSVSPQSICGEAANEESINGNGQEIKTEEYKSNKIFYHRAFITCINNSLWTGVHYISAEQEKKFCDKAFLEYEVKNTITKIKEAKIPSSGRFAGTNIEMQIKVLNKVLEDREENCAIALKKPFDPKVYVNFKIPYQQPESIDDSPRSETKEASGVIPSEKFGIIKPK